jgi:hypothetical protein
MCVSKDKYGFFTLLLATAMISSGKILAAREIMSKGIGFAKLYLESGILESAEQTKVGTSTIDGYIVLNFDPTNPTKIIAK